MGEISVSKSSVKVKFINLSEHVEALYDALDITWENIVSVVVESNKFKTLCVIAFAEDLNYQFVDCSDLTGNLSVYITKEMIRDKIKEIAKRKTNDVNYNKIAIEIATYLASIANTDYIEVYDISDSESAYLIAIPN